MKVVVSGANGFLGSHIVRLLRKDGFEVVALVREGSSSKFIDRSGADICFVDYNNKLDLQKCFSGADFFVHSAALAKDWGEWSEFKRVNIELTGMLINMALEAGIKDVIHISSNAVIGEEDNINRKNEEHDYLPRINYFLERWFPSGMNHYKCSKRDAEERAIFLAELNKLNLTVLRPVWIFGPREFNSGPYEYCKTITSKIPVMPGTNSNKFHTVYVEDVAKSVLCAIQKRLSGVNIFNIGPKRVMFMQEFYGKFCKELGLKRPKNLPMALLFFPVLILELVYLFLKIKTPPLLTRARLYMLYANNIYDVGKAEREIGFVADSDIDYAVRKTVKWWKVNGYL
ncbi:MAG: NAD-dependent epimerase/dehydratase family protein [Bacteriovoracaceae bacterium]|nr:NAD-dependent epimerase/dehydratase family protein [Bacteriovoracaceae bacterium]